MVPPPDAVAVATAPRAARSVWIDGPWRDLALYVATPVLILPLILFGSGRPDVQQLILYVGGFGALGHHLPGMMRAYGDRALFARFRLRFLLAPLLLLPVCVFFSLRELGGVVLVTFLWTNWHTLMQVFGFARIYDAKLGATTRWTSRLDQGLCIAWIVAPLLLSDSRLAGLLELWYGCGGPLLPDSWIEGLRPLWLGTTVATSVAWGLHALLSWRRGKGPNPVKLLFFASSFAFWWFCMTRVDHLLVGIALFDIFHDVQYLALVWGFNRSRVASDPGVGGFSRFLFRGRLTLAGVYVGMVLAYGSIGYFSDSISDELVQRSLLGVLAASALLHFYFDGFIWKVRERSTRRALALEGGGDDIHLGGALPAWSIHGAKWLFFIVPVGVLYAWEVGDERPERVWREAIAASVGGAENLTQLGALIDLREEPERAIALHREAVARKPAHPPAHHNLGVALLATGRVEEARAAFLDAIRLFPDYGAAHRHLGMLLFTTGEHELAEAHFELAIEHEPEAGSSYAGLGMLRAGRGETAAAARLFEQALERDPGERTALNALAWLRATDTDPAERDGERAVECAEELARLTQREDPRVLDTLAAAYAEAGRFEEAVATAAEAVDLARMRGREDHARLFEPHLAEFERGAPWRGVR